LYVRAREPPGHRQPSDGGFPAGYAALPMTRKWT